MIILIPFYILFDFAATLIACVCINWWAPLFAYDGAVRDQDQLKYGYTLPNWLAWFDTFDATLDAGLQPGETSSYWTRMRWLYRNPAYGFSYWVLGCEFDPRKWYVNTYKPEPLTFRAYDADGHYEYMAVRFGIKLKIGWKAWNYFVIDQQSNQAWSRVPWGPEMIAPFVFSISLAK